MNVRNLFFLTVGQEQFWKQNSKNVIIFPFSRNLSQVEYLVDKYGLEIFKERDEYGHSPAHWMALNGHASIARYMATKCGALDLHSDNSQGPRPIHWASRNGHVAVVDILLSAGKV